MARWKTVLLSLFAVVALAAGACAIAGYNPLNLLACEPTDPTCAGTGG